MKAAATVFMLLLCTAAGGLVQEWLTFGHDAQRTGCLENNPSISERDEIVWTSSREGIFPSLMVANEKVFVGSEGSVASGIRKGIYYLFIATVLALALWGLTRLKPVPKRVGKRKR